MPSARIERCGASIEAQLRAGDVLSANELIPRVHGWSEKAVRAALAWMLETNQITEAAPPTSRTVYGGEKFYRLKH